MKIQFFLLLLNLIFMTSSNAQMIHAQNADDEIQLREVVSTLKKGWNDKSGETFASVFADSHDYIVWTGMFAPNISRADNAKQHQQIFDTFYKNTQMENEVSKIKMIRDDLSLVHFYAKVWDKDMPEPEGWEVLISILVEKQEGEWKIIAFHNCDLEKGTGPGAKDFYITQETAIKNKVKSLNQAWNNRDAAALAAHFQDGYDHVVANITWMTDFTRQACEQSHNHLFETVYTKPGNGKISEIKVKFLKADVALVHVRLDEPGENVEKELLTLVFEMDDYENWLISSFNLTPIGSKQSDDATGQVDEKNN